MNPLARQLPESNTHCGIVATPSNRLHFALWWWLIIGLSVAIPAISLAESSSGNSSASASLNFRIVIPAIIRVTPFTQPDHIVIENRHIAQGYIDLDTGTSVKLTNNTRNGYLLTANYNVELLSGVEVRIANQNLTASSGFGSMRVASGFVIDKLVPIGYRFHLAPGVRAGQYAWPVALAFSLAFV